MVKCQNCKVAEGGCRLALLWYLNPPHASEVKGTKVALLIYKKSHLILHLDFYVITCCHCYFAMAKMQKCVEKHTKKQSQDKKSLKSSSIFVDPCFGVFLFIVIPLFRAFIVWVFRIYLVHYQFSIFKCSIVNIAIFLILMKFCC